MRKRRTTRWWFFLVFVTVFAAALDAQAVTYYVRKTGNNSSAGTSPATAWLTITKAATTVAAGSIVYVGGGTYTESVAPTVDGTAVSPIQFIADTDGSQTGDAGAVIINGACTILNVNGDNYLEFYGFTINGQSCSSNIVQWDASVGGVLEDVEIYGSLIRCVSLDNSANLTIRDSIVRDCVTAGGPMSGIHLYTSSSATVIGSDIYNHGRGGVGMGSNGTLTIRESKIHHNTDAGLGVVAGTSTLTNVLVYENGTAGVGSLTAGNMTLRHVTIVGNTGDAVSLSGGSTTIQNSILAFNGDDGIDLNAGTLTHTYNDVHGNTSANFEGTTQSTGEITTDPLFVDRPNDDYHIQETSPAKDTGTDGSAYTTVDYDGDSRPQGSGWDMGFDEIVGGPMDHFSISHDGTGIVGIAEDVTIAAHDASHAVKSNYMGTLVLSTSTSAGDWTLVTGSGTLDNGTAGDGAATYTFVAGDSGDVVLSLTNGTAETLNIGVSQGGYSEHASEDANLTFSAPAAIYYSVGTSTADLKSGSPTITISSGTATFSVAQPNNIGVGDKITYNTSSIAYISGRTSSTVYSVITATGGTPANVSGQTVNSIKRTFNSLSSAESDSTGASYLNTSDLVAGNYQLNWPCYNDGILSQGAALFIDGWTTGASNYLRIFTPTASSEVGTSQRHTGTAGTGFRINQTSGSINVFEEYTRIDGIEMYGTASRIVASATGTGDIRVSHSIFHGRDSSFSGGCIVCTQVNATAITYKIYNNIFYDNTHTFGTGIQIANTGYTVYAYNNTVYGMNYRGIERTQSTVTATNNVVVGSGNADFSGTLTQSYNVSSDATASGTGSQTNKTDYANYFVDITGGSEDLHLKDDSNTLWGSNGADLDQDANLSITADIDGDSRDASTPDIGADETTGAAASSLDHFAISHDGSGIHCAAEMLTVTAEDSGGSAVADYTGTITLDTQSGKGTWNLVTGNGSFSDDVTDNDGLATYTFADSDDGVASFLLEYEEGTAAINVDAYTAGRAQEDDDTEGDLTFYASGFTVTASALPNPPPNPVTFRANQTAGTAFNMYIAAYGTTDTDPECGIIETYDGDKAVKFWSTYASPSSGTVQVTVDGNAVATSEGAASPQTVSFSNGQAVVSAKYKDVGRIQILLKDDTVLEPVGGIQGATINFVVKPADFVVTQVERTSDGFDNPGSDVPAEPAFMVAGDPFTVAVEVRDAEGSRTPNYGNESTPEGIEIVASSLVAPVGGRNGSNNDGVIINGTAFSAVAPAGTFRCTTCAWDEVGAIRLTASVADGSYLGTGDVTGSESGVVGRFTPDHFTVSPNTPQFATACGTFTYVGQAFDYSLGSEPGMEVTAVAAAGTPTRNYTGSWWKITAGSLATRSYQSLSDDFSLEEDPGADPDLMDQGNGTPAEENAGKTTVTFDNDADFSFTRADTPSAAFNAEIAFAVTVKDEDLVEYAGEAGAPVVSFGAAAVDDGIAFSSGKEQRYGRVALQNAHGSDLYVLPVPLRAEYWNGSFWILNTDDGCSAMDPEDDLNLSFTPIELDAFTDPAVATPAFSLGDAGLSFSAPGTGNTGYVNIEADLSGAGLSYLLWDWDGDGGADDNPTGRATFGIYTGDDQKVFEWVQ